MSSGRTIYRDYPTQTEQIKEFINSFQGSDGTEKYKALIDKIIQRQSDTLEIELDDVYEYNSNLANCISDNTHRYIEMFSRVVDDMIPETLDMSNQFDAIAATRLAAYHESGSETKFPPELHRRFAVHFIPPVKQKIIPMREVRADSIGHLVRIRGLVTRITQVKPLISVATYTCDQCSEETFQTITSPTFIPQTICQSQTCQSKPKPGQLTLQTRGSKFQKFQMLRIQELSSEVPAGHIPRSMTIYARDSLVQRCQTGDVIDIAGIFLPLPIKAYKQSLVSETYIEAQSIEVAPKYDQSAEADESDELNLPPDVPVYDALAKAVAPEIFGLEDVKKALLLQLVSGVTRKIDDGVRIRGDINICLMGDPGVAKSQLLKWVARISPRAVYTTGRGSSGVGLTAAVLKDPVTGEMALEGGALVLADKGICCIDEFDKMEDADRTAIYEVMEQQTVSIAKAGITTTLNARTSILAAANPVHSRYNQKRSLLENVNLPAALLSRFDLLFLLLDNSSQEQDTALANHIASVHMNKAAPTSEYSVGLKAFRNHLLKAKDFHPVIPDSLVKHITDAYVAKRQEATNEPITPRSLLAVIRLSIALAKIRLAEKVDQRDVDEALRLLDASKQSVEINHKREARGDTSSAIFERITQLWIDSETVQMDEIRKYTRNCGFTDEELERCISEYVDIGVLQLNPAKTVVTFVERKDKDE